MFSRQKKYRINRDLVVATVTTKHGDFHSLGDARLVMFRMLSRRFKRINLKRITVTYSVWVKK